MFSFFQRQKRPQKNLQHLFSLYLLIKLIHCFNEIARFNPRTNRIDTLCIGKNNVPSSLLFKTVEHMSYDRTPIFGRPTPNLYTVKPARPQARNNILIPLCPPALPFDEDESFQPADPYHHKQPASLRFQS